ncbi:hypothetical protein GCM10023170_098160 [Phytohabitans houttuyneae]|uniref:Uncharacterized protein n=1 Tax=Phytohabitans houttuyneae TaxID=1076126 RepID=A0A6V8KSA5_9ACTN|nr:hypothetical protein Phou_076750 [Phytohabitans houttuyneae]
MTAQLTILADARAEALFASDLSASSQPMRAEVAAAIRHAVRKYGGARGCLAEVAAAYGDHPPGPATPAANQRQCTAHCPSNTGTCTGTQPVAPGSARLRPGSRLPAAAGPQPSS